MEDHSSWETQLELKTGKIKEKKKQTEEAELSQSKGKNCEDLSPIGKKRGRVKLKKLPLSICTSKDRAQPKEEIRARSSPLTRTNTGNNPVNSMPSFTVESSTDRVMPIEAT